MPENDSIGRRGRRVLGVFLALLGAGLWLDRQAWTAAVILIGTGLTIFLSGLLKRSLASQVEEAPASASVETQR